ncbi:family 1 glycosylhydrolase, partial [Nonomuraea sp. NPDC055795]
MMTEMQRVDPSLDYTFPEGFLWGAGTNGVQNEGAPLADGGGPSIWHPWSRTPGNVLLLDEPTNDLDIETLNEL